MHDDSTCGHPRQDGLSFEEKLIRLLEHWIKHNEDHVLTYRQWADQAKAHGLKEAALRVEEAAAVTRTVSEKFEAALSFLTSRKG